MKRLKRKPDFDQFLKVLQRQGKPSYLPFYEHVASPGFIARRTESSFNRLTLEDKEYWPIYVDFWLGMGYDCIPMEVGFNCKVPAKERTGISRGSESHVAISNRGDFENFGWPPESEPIQFRHFDTVSKLLPEGVKIVAGVGGGPYEWVSVLMGVMGLSYALMDDPELVSQLFGKLGRMYQNAVCQLASMESVGALRQGDDLGFKTSTFLSPEQLRQYVFPIYKAMVKEAHVQNKPFILHSCGNLAEVYDDLIDECKIDAKHSFEDVILPVHEFKKIYGDRVTPLGGLDVDFICRNHPDEIRSYTRRNIDLCFSDGYWALGTGNSLTDYMPVENYIAVLEEGLKVEI